MSQDKPSYLNFNASTYAWKADIDYQKRPDLYRVGKGEQGVLICEPYKSEIGKFWRFKDENIARESSSKIYELFLAYLSENDFVGADMARKYLQMGFIRARRYYNYRGGKKYDSDNNHKLLERGTGDPEKARSASIFYNRWKEAEDNQQYNDMKTIWKQKFG